MAYYDLAISRTPALAFHGELSGLQMESAEILLNHETGVLVAPTAFGKTVVAAWLIARRQVSTLVLVHTRQLMDQWINRLESFLRPEAAPIDSLSVTSLHFTKNNQRIMRPS
jgi:superfamily II DNA or RNA helicase